MDIKKKNRIEEEEKEDGKLHAEPSSIRTFRFWHVEDHLRVVTSQLETTEEEGGDNWGS